MNPSARPRLAGSTHVIKYLGSKRTLIPELLRIVGAFPELTSAIDLFSGTSRVGHALKKSGMRVIANDYNRYAHTLARCYVEADDALAASAQTHLDQLADLDGPEGWFTETYCRQSRFFQPNNGTRIEAIRQAIGELDLEPLLEAVLLTSLMEAADRVDSTCGVQMAYVKSWSKRSHNALQLRLPALLPRSVHGRGEAHRGDSNAFVQEAHADIMYIDPPYNQHSYLGNYHIWETLIEWDNPEVYGVAKKRVECRERKSDYNSKRRHEAAFAHLIEHANAQLLVVSFSDEAFLPRAALEAVLAKRGPTLVFEHDFKRYVGAQIGIFAPSGKRVGEVSHLRNTERIYVTATQTACASVRARVERGDL